MSENPKTIILPNGREVEAGEPRTIGKTDIEKLKEEIANHRKDIEELKRGKVDKENAGQ